MCVQAVLDFVEAFLEVLPERFRFRRGYFSSSLEITESKSSILKEGCEVRFDIIHRTVVLVDKGAPFLVRQRHRDPRAIPSGPRCGPPFGPYAYL